jgi:hypothetical protein
MRLGSYLSRIKKTGELAGLIGDSKTKGLVESRRDDEESLT